MDHAVLAQLSDQWALVRANAHLETRGLEVRAIARAVDRGHQRLLTATGDLDDDGLIGRRGLTRGAALRERKRGEQGQDERKRM